MTNCPTEKIPIRVLLWDEKIIIDEENAWGRVGVYLGKNNLSIYFFQYIEYINIFLSIYRTYRYILDNIISIDRYIDISLSICHSYLGFQISIKIILTVSLVSWKTLTKILKKFPEFFSIDFYKFFQVFLLRLFPRKALWKRAWTLP